MNTTERVTRYGIRRCTISRTYEGLHLIRQNRRSFVDPMSRVSETIECPRLRVTYKVQEDVNPLSDAFVHSAFLWT